MWKTKYSCQSKQVCSVSADIQNLNVQFINDVPVTSIYLYATYDTAEEKTLSAGSLIPWNVIEASGITSTFSSGTALISQDGVYLITYSVTSETANPFGARLFKSNQSIQEVYGYSGNVSGSIVKHFNSGDTVSLRFWSQSIQLKLGVVESVILNIVKV